MPMCTSSSVPSSRLSPGMASRIPSAARTARSASLSCATGAPNTAMTQSPMCLSTLPPKRSIRPSVSAKKRSVSSWVASAPSCRVRRVNPARSQNSTVTCRRSPSAAAMRSGRARSRFVPPSGCPSGLPQPPQKRSSGWLTKPHSAQARASGAPQLPQKRRPSRFSAPHREHCIADPARALRRRSGRRGLACAASEGPAPRMRSRRGPGGQPAPPRAVRRR